MKILHIVSPPILNHQNRDDVLIHYGRTSPSDSLKLTSNGLLKRSVLFFTLTFALACGDSAKELTPPQTKKDQTLTQSEDRLAQRGGSSRAPQFNVRPRVPQPNLNDPLRTRPDLAPQDRVLIVVDGEERYVARDVAVHHGYTLIDLRDQWTPNIFKTYQNQEGEFLEHSYREIFVGLANDTGNNEGQPLEDGEFNFLEVFGIPPSMSVISKRVMRESTEPCYREVDYEKIARAKSIRFGNRARQRKFKKQVKSASALVERKMKKHLIDSYEELLQVEPRLKKKVKLLEKYQIEKEAIEHIERRLDCDMHSHPRYRHKKGRLDQGLRMAIRRFQRKHKLYEYANLKSDTIEALATPAMVVNMNSLRRSISERVIAATGILEDGTVNRKDKTPTFTGADGKEHEMRNLVKEFTDATMDQLNLKTPDQVKHFFLNHPRDEFKHLQIGVKLPELPEYYSPHMEFNIVVDRGDIWYDPPFNPDGKKIKQRRRRLPKFKLYTTYRDQRIQLIHWPTTIGGWRKEIANNGHEYLKYKNSDVGKRVIRKVISGPVWVPPKSTPLKSLAKRRYVNGKAQNIVNYEEMGPDYLSAYGLVAGYFVIPGREGRRDHDRGIRAHGSSDFMSILSSERFSHGCHRLKNDHAVRLYGFLLKHRNHIVRGDQKIRHERQFLYKDQIYEVRHLTRGFLFEMTPPIPVEVLEGRVLSRLKKYIEDYVELPDHEYPNGLPDDSPIPEELKEAEKSGGAEAPAGDPSPTPSKPKPAEPSNPTL